MTCIVRRIYLCLWAFIAVWPLSAAAGTFALILPLRRPRTLTGLPPLSGLLARLALPLRFVAQPQPFVLHLPKGAVGQVLLVAQGLGHAPARAFALAAPLALTALGPADLHIFHHAVELIQQGLRLGHLALVH